MPFIVRWPGKIKAGSTSEHICAFWDFLPTCCELIGADAPADIDGISILPTLLGRRNEQKKHKYLYWELRGRQGVRMGRWKVVRLKPNQKIQLYDLDNDIGEQNDVAGANPDIVAKMAEIMKMGRTESEVFPMPKPKT